MTDYEKLRVVLEYVYDMGTCWTHATDPLLHRDNVTSSAMQKIEDFLDIEWAEGDIVAICGKEL